MPRNVRLHATVKSHRQYDIRISPELEKEKTWLLNYARSAKQAHPGRVCDYDENAECAETIAVNEVSQPCSKPSKEEDHIVVGYDLVQQSDRVTGACGTFTSAGGGIFRLRHETYRLNSDRNESSSIWLPAASQ